MQLFNEATLDLSKSGEPTICKVLPLFKLIETHLEDVIANFALEYDDPYGIQNAFEKGLKKHQKYLQKALVSDYPLLGAGESFS